MSRRFVPVTVAGTSGTPLRTGDVVTGSAQRDVVIQNGLIKLTFEETTEPGAHTLYRWNGSEYVCLMSPEYGDWTYFASEFTSGPDRTRIEYADADRVKVVLEWDAHAANAAQWPADYEGGPTGFYQRNHLGALNYDSNAHPIRVATVHLYKIVEVRRGREGYFRAMRSDPHLGPYSGLSGNNDTSLGERESGTGGGNAVFFASSGFIARHPAWGSDANWGGAGNYPANRHAWARIDDPDYGYTAIADYIGYQNGAANGESPTYPNEQTDGPWWVADIPNSSNVAAGFVRYIALVERMEAGSWQFASDAYGFTSIHHSNDIRGADGRWQEFQMFVGAFPYEADTSNDYANEPTVALKQKVAARVPLNFEDTGNADDNGVEFMTVASVRDELGAAVRNLTPDSLAHVKYRAHDNRQDFRDWCNANPQAAFRKYQIRDVGSVAGGEVYDAQQTWHVTELECVVAYPRDYRYGTQALHDLSDVLWEDLNALDNAIGTNSASGATTATITTLSKDTEEGAACVFAVLRLQTEFWRSTALAA